MGTVKMDNAGLVRRINEYIARAKKDRYALPELGKKGDYLIVTGSEHSRVMPEIYRGRFIDVLVRAVQMSEFYGDWCSTDDMWNPNHGHLEIYKPKKVVQVPVTKGIMPMLAMQEKLDSTKLGLENIMRSANEEIEKIKLR